MTQKATIDFIYQSKLRTIDDIIDTLTSSPVELRQLLIDLFAKNTIKSAISLLWKHYSDLKSANKTEMTDKDQDDLLQLTLIFHHYDAPDLDTLTIGQVFVLMYTGKIDGDVSKSQNDNFLPAGFWQLPLLHEALIDVLAMNTKLITASMCSSSFILPDDWQDKKHPTGLFMDVDSQVDLLLPSIADVLRGEEVSIAQSDLMSRVAKASEKADEPEKKSDEGDKEPE
jgi:hypothetical protein